MKILLDSGELEKLERQHKTERDKRVADRIKAVILNAEGWSCKQIAQALRIHPETISSYIKEYAKSKNVKPCNKGSESHLNTYQTEELLNRLDSVTYLRVIDICYHVEQKYGINYSVSGMTAWLKKHGFAFKQFKGQPAKASHNDQMQFEEKYRQLCRYEPSENPIMFMDGVHPTMQTKLSYGWIRKGTEKKIKTTASRTRMNILGSLNMADNMKIISKEYDSLNSEAVIDHLKDLRKHYPNAEKIHLILDQSGYNKAEIVQKIAKKCNVILHYLPPYSPNLNPIERVWKIMNEYARNNKYFKTASNYSRLNQVAKTLVKDCNKSRPCLRHDESAPLIL